MQLIFNVSRSAAILFSLVLFALGLLAVSAFNSGGPPSFVGHSSEEGAVPPGAIMYFNLSTCPNGWTSANLVAGRYIVGQPIAGTLEGSSGTALSNLESRPVGAHSHSINDPGHSHSLNDPGHSHANFLTDPGHSHGIGVQSSGVGTIPFAGNTGPSATGTTNAATTGVTITNAAATTGMSVNSAGTSISVNSAGAVAGTPAPYVQYLACVKS